MGTGVTHKRIATTRFVAVHNAARSYAPFRFASHRVFRSQHSLLVPVCLVSFAAGIPFLAVCVVHTLIPQQPLLFFLRKEVIQPHLPIRLPCYDFTPVIRPAFGRSFHSKTVRSRTSGISDSHGVTGGVYKTRERIHRDMLIRDY